MDALEPYGLWSEAHRVIGIARRLLNDAATVGAQLKA
jgi:hypothetical protein